MSEFGALLRKQREERGWRQQDLADALAGGLARSSIANIEAGRELPSDRLWGLITQHLPEWSKPLGDSYELVRAKRQAQEPANDDQPLRGRSRARSTTRPVDSSDPVLGGPFAIEQLTLVYVFNHSRAPEEIIEIRRVRALRNGADRYGLKLAQSESADFSVEEHALFGGHLATSEHHRGSKRTVYLRTFQFDRRLRRGQTHEFAVRSWVEDDPEPGTDVQVDLTVPVRRVGVHLNFRGPAKPRRLWTYGPVADDSLVPAEPGEDTVLELGPEGTASLYLTDPQTGPTYGIGWRW